MAGELSETLVSFVTPPTIRINSEWHTLPTWILLNCKFYPDTLSYLILSTQVGTLGIIFVVLQCSCFGDHVLFIPATNKLSGDSGETTVRSKAAD